MKTLEERATMRDNLVKLAKDSVVERAAKLFLSQYRSDLEHLKEKDQVPTHVPIGKDRFVKWVKDVLNMFFPEVSGATENEKILKEYAVQIADLIAKSNTDVVNPMKDYVVNKEPVYIKAGAPITRKKAQMEPNAYSGSLKTPNLYTAPTEHSRYCPDHPGSMMRRVSDNVYQCPISGDLNMIEPWKDKFDYRGGHEVRFETGVQNQTSEGPNNMHPLLPFLHHETDDSTVTDFKGKPYDFEKLYGVKSTPVERQDQKLASDMLSKITKIAEDEACPKCGMKDCPCMKEGKPCECKPKKEASKDLTTAQSYKTQQLFGPTTVMSRQCPDHPGQQLIRMSDNVRKCPLDERVYDFVRGFTTDDGEQHNGGSVNAQMAIPPGSILVKVKANSDAILVKEGSPSVDVKIAKLAADTPSAHEFLYSILQHLPASAEKERKILNYKFQKGVSLEEAMRRVTEAEQFAAQSQVQTQPGQTPAQAPTQAASTVKSFVRS